MLCSYSNKTLAHNSIYSIHSSYYSFVISLYLELAVSTIYLIINAYSSFSYFDYCSLLTFHFSSFLWIFIFARMNDPRVESYPSITRIEQYSMIIGIKLLLISELMLFFSCFWLLIHFRFISNTSSIFISSPLLSSYSLSIARSNVLILQLPSLPIQPTQLFSSHYIFAFND